MASPVPTPSGRAAAVLLAALFGAVTAAAFAAARFLPAIVGDVPALVLGATAVAVGGSVVAASLRGVDPPTCLLVALGPAAGLAAYLLAYRLIYPPSADSPTWIVFLAFAGGFLGYGGVAFLAGRALARALGANDNT